MKRLLAALLLPVLAAAGLALAEPPAFRDGARPTSAERLRKFRRNLDLVRKLVDGGLELAKETDPLRRADSCNRLARGLTHEIQRAVADRDSGRADELGQHLKALLEHGIAGNLRRVSDGQPPDAPTNPEVRRLGKEAISVMQPLRDALERVPQREQPDMQGVVDAVTDGRDAVERAMSGKGRTKTRPPPAGKKLKTGPR